MFECFGFDVDIEEDQLNELGPHETEDASNASVFPRANQNNTVINEFMIEEQPLEFPTDTQNAASERLEHLTAYFDIDICQWLKDNSNALDENGSDNQIELDGSDDRSDRGLHRIEGDNVCLLYTSPSPRDRG